MTGAMLQLVAGALVLSSVGDVARAAVVDETITAVGSVYCDGGPNDISSYPLTGLRVELVDSDCDGSQICDQVMGTSHVKSDGTFSVNGQGGDPFGGRPDVYLRFVYNDDAGVRLTDELDRSRSFSTPEHDHDNTGSGTVDFGAWLTGVGASQGSQCRVWSQAHTEFQAYVTEVGAPPPAGHLDVEYWSAVWSGTPWTNIDTSHWPIHYPSQAMPHEFGHSVRHAADGSGSHFAGDVAAYRYARVHSRCAADANAQPGESLASIAGYGFNEGWAHYWGKSVGGCPGTVDPNIEGEIAWALNGVQVNTKSSRKDMLQVLLANPGTIHSLDDFMRAFAARVGSSASALLADARSRSRIRAESERPGAPYSEAQRVAEIRAQILAIDDMVRQHRAAVLAAPLGGPAKGGTHGAGVACRRDECEATFKAVVGPHFRGAEERALMAYRTALQRALSADWASQAQRAQAGGTLEAWLRQYRMALEEQVRGASAKGVADARQAMQAARGAFGSSYAAYAAVLDQAVARLQGGKASPSNEPFRPALVLPEDRARQRQ